MVAFIVRRALLAIPMLIFISFISFIIIQLPPGDYITAYAAQLRQNGEYISAVQEATMRDRMGLNDSAAARSWNSSHASRGGCSVDAFKGAGGAGLLYCFAAN